jgi:hypothetical protein
MTPAHLSLAAPSHDIAFGCINLIENGGFEAITPHWQVQPGSRPPMYTNEFTFNNSLQSMRVGNGLELANVASTSEVRHIAVQFPPDATRIILRFRYSPRHDGEPDADLQQVDVYDHNMGQLALSVLNAQENDANWRLVERDLTEFRGRLISLRFRVQNDGQLGRTLMYVDNVEIEYCALTPIPTNTHTPTGTPVFSPTWTPIFATWTNTPVPISTLIPEADLPPPSCANNILPNGSFETTGNWHIGEDPVPPRYTSQEVHGGARSMLLGNPPGVGPNVVTYSSIRQLVSLPFDTNSAQLRWWQMPFSQESPNLAPSRIEDRQEVILLTPKLRTIVVLDRFRLADGVWQQRELDLTPYAGQKFYIYFNVWNDANDLRTWMFLDDIELYACAPSMLLSVDSLPVQPPAPAPGGYPPLGPAEVMPTAIPPSPTAISPTVAPPTATPPLPSATPVAQVELPTFTPSPTATTAGVQVVVIPETPPADATADNLFRPPEVSVEAPAAPWSFLLSQLGTIAILLAIIVIIGLLAALYNRRRLPE